VRRLREVGRRQGGEVGRWEGGDMGRWGGGNYTTFDPGSHHPAILSRACSDGVPSHASQDMPCKKIVNGIGNRIESHFWGMIKK
jgi:hypothetical protein